MDLSLTQEQLLIKSSVESFLRDRYSLALRQASAQSPQGYDPQLWQAFCHELGTVGMTLPHALGGLDADAITTMVVMEAMGNALVLEPYLETVVLCGGLLQELGGETAERLLVEMAAGENIMALAWSEPAARQDPLKVRVRASKSGEGWRLSGLKSVVHTAPWASGVLVTAVAHGCSDHELSVFWVAKGAAGMTMQEYPTIDGRRAADITFDQVEVGPEGLIGNIGGATAGLKTAIAKATAALCAEAIGVLRRLLSDTVAYTQQREQFGQPIGQFQVLQHRMVDMYMAVEMAASATLLANISAANNSSELQLHASMAKVQVNEACRSVGQAAVQLHGGMGMTDELAISHYFKRATVIEMMFGSTDFHRSTVAALCSSD